MNTLKLLSEKVERIKIEEYLKDINFVMIHISRAEHYFKLAKEKGESDYYNDVIYRTNQAYEGSLRCAYNILLEKKSSNKSTSNLEQELKDANILNDRVKNMFSIYRNDWRNQSAHNYDELFSESEAFMAINNVNSFFYLLLSFIEEKDSYVRSAREFEKISMIKSKGLSFIESVTETLINFPSLYYENIIQKSKENLSEFELLGVLQAFIKKVLPEVTIIREYSLESTAIKLDLVIKTKTEEVAIEVKTFKNHFAIKNVISNFVGICESENIKRIIIFHIDGLRKYKKTRKLIKDIEMYIIGPDYEKEEI